jgi:hypothetical protein
MRRKLQLALVAGALAATAVPAGPARAEMICTTGDPLTDKVVCGTIGLAAQVICKVSGGKYCMT